MSHVTILALFEIILMHLTKGVTSFIRQKNANIITHFTMDQNTWREIRQLHLGHKVTEGGV